MNHIYRKDIFYSDSILENIYNQKNMRIFYNIKKKKQIYKYFHFYYEFF